MDTYTSRTCPLLDDVANYDPDTLNLSEDAEARAFWFQSVKDMVLKFSHQAVQSQPEAEDAVDRAEAFCADVTKEMTRLLEHGTSKLTIRTLLNLNEMCLRRHGFDDPWLDRKRLENEQSIKKLEDRLAYIDSIAEDSSDEKWTELIRGVLAG